MASAVELSQAHVSFSNSPKPSGGPNHNSRADVIAFSAAPLAVRVEVFCFLAPFAGFIVAVDTRATLPVTSRFFVKTGRGKRETSPLSPSTVADSYPVLSAIVARESSAHDQ